MSNNRKDSSVPLRPVKKVQFGIISPEEIVSGTLGNTNDDESVTTWSHKSFYQTINYFYVRNECLLPTLGEFNTHIQWKEGSQR